MSFRFRIRAATRLAAVASVERVVQVEPREGDLVIGRRRGDDIELPFADVSEPHARLTRGERGWLLTDLGSANGTYVNGRRLTPFAACPGRRRAGRVTRIDSHLGAAFGE